MSPSSRRPRSRSNRSSSQALSPGRRALIVAAVALIGAAGACAFPAWNVTAFYPGTGETKTETAYAVAWSPPSEHDGQYRRVRSAEIHVERTALTAAIVLFVGLAASLMVYVVGTGGASTKRGRH